MKNFTANHTLSVGVRMRACEGGSCRDHGNLCLQVIIDRKPDRIPLGIKWPMDKFNPNTGELLPRHKHDQQCSDYNLEIGQAMAKANEIAVDVRLGKRSISHEEFKFRFKNFASKESLLLYMENKALKRKTSGEIKASTYIRNVTNINRLRNFAIAKNENATFDALTKSFTQRFKNWLVDEQKLQHNTVTASLKFLKNYCRQAATDGYRFDPEVLNMKTTFRPGRKIGLNEDEIQLLKNDFISKSRTPLEHECLRKFLFMVFTGLRISDANRLNSRQINNGQMDILMFKTRDSGKKVIMGLPSFALQLIKGRKGVIFNDVTDSLFNKTIKRISADLGISKTVSAHVARFTFARFLYHKTGNLKAVSDLLGHSSIRTTEIYLQIDDEQRDSVMKHLDQL
jgi:integrase